MYIIGKKFAVDSGLRNAYYIARLSPSKRNNNPTIIKVRDPALKAKLIEHVRESLKKGDIKRAEHPV